MNKYECPYIKIAAKIHFFFTFLILHTDASTHVPECVSGNFSCSKEVPATGEKEINGNHFFQMHVAALNSGVFVMLQDGQKSRKFTENFLLSIRLW